MWENLAQAICLMLVIEGIIPFLSPQRWRKMVAVLAEIDDRAMRIMGLICMLLGALGLFLVS